MTSRDLPVEPEEQERLFVVQIQHRMQSLRTKRVASTRNKDTIELTTNKVLNSLQVGNRLEAWRSPKAIKNEVKKSV